MFVIGLSQYSRYANIHLKRATNPSNLVLHDTPWEYHWTWFLAGRADGGGKPWGHQSGSQTGCLRRRGYGLLLSYIKSIYASVRKPIFRLNPRSSNSSHPDPRVNRVSGSLDRSLDPHHPSSRINQSRQSSNLLVFLAPLVATALYVSHGYRTMTKSDVLMLHGCLDCIVGPTGGIGYGTVRYA